MGAEAKVNETDQILATDKADATVESKEKDAQSPDDESFDDFSDDDTKDEANDNDVQKLANDMEKEKAKVAETDKILATDKADAAVESKEKDAAAVKIQSAARGSQARTEKKRKDAAEKKRKDEAAVKIQSNFKGHGVRKQLREKAKAEAKAAETKAILADDKNGNGSMLDAASPDDATEAQLGRIGHVLETILRRTDGKRLTLDQMRVKVDEEMGSSYKFDGEEWRSWFEEESKDILEELGFSE